MRKRVIASILFLIWTSATPTWATHESPPGTSQADMSSTAAAPSGSATGSSGGSSAIEFYAGAYGGYAFPGSFTDIKYTGPLSGIGLSDIKHDGGGLFGAKIGGYLRNSYIGGEVEGFYTSLSTPEQTLIVTGPGGSASFRNASGSQDVWAGAINLLLRYPGKVVQPYIGVGLAVVHLSGPSDSSVASTSGGATAPGLNALVGVRAKVSEHFSVFGEFKYVYASFELKDVVPGVPGVGAEMNLSMPAAVAGVAWHF